MAHRVRRAAALAVAGGLTAALATAVAGPASATPQPTAIASGYLGSYDVTIDGQRLKQPPIAPCYTRVAEHGSAGWVTFGQDVADFWGGTADCTHDEQGNASAHVAGQYFSTGVLREWGGPRIRLSSFDVRCDTRPDGSSTVMELDGVFGLDLPQQVPSNTTVTIEGPVDDGEPLAKVYVNELIAPVPPDGSLGVNALRIVLFPEGGPASGEIIVGAAACDPYGTQPTRGVPTSSTPPWRSWSSAWPTVSSDTPAVRSSSVRTVNPSRAASSAVARTQWSVATPTTSTLSTSRERSHAASGLPSGDSPSKPE